MCVGLEGGGGAQETQGPPKSRDHWFMQAGEIKDNHGLKIQPIPTRRDTDRPSKQGHRSDTTD